MQLRRVQVLFTLVGVAEAAILPFLPIVLRDRGLSAAEIGVVLAVAALAGFVATPLEGRVIAKTGSIDRVNSLSGYIERANGRTITFSVQANGHAVPYQQMLNQIDSVVVQIGRP